jgi:SpoVK/Ycf46/Vps4 family AAA+-type ATPase
MGLPFENNFAYLSAELELLNLLIRREVSAWRRSAGEAQQDLFKGVFISEGEVDELLESISAQARGADAAGADLLREQASVLRRDINERRQATLEQGVYLPLAHLSHAFRLSPFEEQLVLICLAPEIDLRYEKFYAYLQDDMSRKRPSLGLACRLLGATPAERLQARAAIAPPSSLVRGRVLSFKDDEESYLLARAFRLDERIVNFMLGANLFDKEMDACLKSPPPTPDLASLRWHEELKTQLLDLTRAQLKNLPVASRRLVYNFYGPRGTGRKTLAASLCRELGVPLLLVDLREIAQRFSNVGDALHRALREAVLQPCAIFVEHFDLLLAEGDRGVAQSRLAQFAQCVEEYSWLTFVSTEKSWEPAGLFKDHLFLSVELPAPDVSRRAHLWEEFANHNGSRPEVRWDEVASKFKLTPGQMLDALAAGRSYAALRSSEQSEVTTDDLHRGCRAQSNQRLGAAARKVARRHTWSDITLPDKELTQLRELCAQVRHRQKVYGDWGFGGKMSLSKGLCALFSGPSGAGKTMAVEIISGELRLDAFKIDLAQVVSKYIGETEKNLSAIFDEAETSNAILFFDEADALFGKRSEVKDAHDRYANIEINYLLQRIEEFEGLVILATNLRKNIDEAFFRRIHFAVEFPFPDERHRYLIWKQHFPESAPVASDIDFNFLAGRVNVTGGHIKNIVVNAAFMAADGTGVIDMGHMMRATRREYEKIGRMCTEGEFAPYHSLLSEY